MSNDHAAGSARGSGSRKYIALVSGLGVGGVSGEPLAVSLLVDWLTGLLGGPEDQAQAAQVGLLSAHLCFIASASLMSLLIQMLGDTEA